MKLTLLHKKTETPDVTSFIFRPTEPLVWKAGQYLHYVLHHRPTDERGSDRWFTVSAAPSEGHVMVTTRFTPQKGSTFKKTLAELQEGEEIEISSVEGDFTVEDPNRAHVFIAGGIGITPFRAILKELMHEKKSIHATLLYANKDQHIVYKEELDEIAKSNENFHIHYIFSPEHIDELKIRELIADIHKPVFYISGPEPMVESLGDTLRKMGIEEKNIKQDWFPGYEAE